MNIVQTTSSLPIYGSLSAGCRICYSEDFHLHICHDEPLLFRRKAEKRIIELSPCKVRLIRSDDLTSQAGGDRSALGRMDDFLSEKVQEHGIVRFGKKKRACNRLDYRLLLADRVGFEPTSRLRDYLISSLVRTWHFRVCRGRWRQFWKRRKPLCCNGFRTHRPVLTSSISGKTRVQIEMGSAPKRSIFLRAGKKIRKKKTLARYGFADSHPD